MKKIMAMIVEDDFKVAETNKNITEEITDFKVVKIAKDAADALSYLEKGKVDLIILDIYLPDMQGTELLKIIRKKEYPVDIILITAAHDAETVECSLRFGIFDYIIKPFDFDRYQDSLSNYRDFRISLEKNQEYDQQRVNELVSYHQGNISSKKLPKGITHYTLDKIKTAIDSFMLAFTIEDIINKVSFSKITVRRYLEFLNEIGTINKSYEYKKVGRPTIIYSKNN